MDPRKLIVSLAGASVLASVLVVGPAFAGKLALGSTRYVRIVRTHGQLVLRLTAAGQQRFGSEVRGKLLTADCVRLRKTAAGLVSAEDVEGFASIPGPHGRRINVSLVDPHADFCDVVLTRTTRIRHGTKFKSLPGPPLDAVPLTERGAEYLNEDQVTQQLLFVIDIAQAFAAQHRPRDFPTASELTKIPGTVALRSANSTPPAHEVGYFSNGRDYAEVVARSASGQRLFIAIKHGIQRTNVADHIARILAGRVPIPTQPFPHG